MNRQAHDEVWARVTRDEESPYPRVEDVVSRRLPWLRSVLVLLIVAACSGDSVSPPPTGGGAVTLSITVGDGQQALPGAAVPAAPVVLATNAAGQPASGVVITFAIDSGGGTIASAQATTNSAGVASPGAWTLGATEGSNVLRVSAAGATTIRIRAMATAATVPLLTDVSVPRTGGVLTVAVPGNPFNGLTLDVPDTAYAGPAVFSIATKDTRVTTLPAGYAQVGPTLVITNSEGTATQPMVLTIPVTVQSPDTALAAFFVNPETGVLELLPVSARDATSLTVFSRHFTADRMFKTAAAPRVSPRTSGVTPATKSAGFSPALIIIVKVPADTLNAVTNTGFQPGRDDWEFVNYGTIVEPEGICAGMTISAMYYFYARRAGGSLHGRYTTVTGGELRNSTNTAGLRLATVVQQSYSDAGLNAWRNLVLANSRRTGVPEHKLHYQSLVMAMQVTKMPQLLGIFGTGFGHAVIAIGSANGIVSFADPNEPGSTRTMTFANGVFTPFPFSSRGGGAIRMVTTVTTWAASAAVSEAALATNWAQVADSSIGRTRFPKAVIQQFDAFTRRFVDVDTAKAVVFSSLADYRIRTRCSLAAGCKFAYPGFDEPLVNTRVINETGALLIDATLVEPIVTLQPGAQRLGIIEAVPTAAAAGWLSWSRFRWITVNYQPVSVLPKFPSIAPDSTLAFTVTSGELAPQIAKYTWAFNDGQPAATTTLPAVSHKYAAGGSYKLLVTMSDAANKVIAKDSTTVTVGGGAKWQLDQFTITARTCPGTCTEVNFAEFERLAVTPASGVLYAYPTAVTPSLGSNFPTPGIYLAVSPRGVTTPPVPWAPATNVTWPLGNTFVGQSAGGFAISNTFDWTGSNTSGTVAGAASPIDQVTNDFRFTIQATKSGNTISGTMTMVQRTRPSLAVVFAYTATFRGQVVP